MNGRSLLYTTACREDPHRGPGVEMNINRRAGWCTMKLSARNQLPGKVKAVNMGVVTAEVVITLDGGGELVSVITKTSAENLGIAVGKKVHAVVKSTEVMVAVD